MKYNPKPFESLFTRFIAQQVKRIEGLIDEALEDVSRQARRINPGGSGTFSFRSHPALSKAVDGLIGELAQGISRTITAGTEWSWNLANAKNDAMLAKVISSIGASRIPPGAIERWSQKNLPALSAFQGRKVAGMSLSDRVWAFTRGIKGDIELALDLGLAEGTGADRLSRVVRGYLNEPDRLYRRVRDERGVLHLSKAASNYHPGRGVYRSSYKNAVRLTATETNMAYRSADYERAQQLDFILGIEVHLSNNHTCLDAKGVPRPFYDICDELEGVYPKDFKFVGWHPNCRCYTTTVLPDKDEFYKYLDAMDENGVSSYEFKGVVTDVPRQMTDWLIGNEDRVLRAKSVPYFIKDNPEISVSPEMSVRIDAQLREDARLNRERDNIAKDIIERKDSYTLVERKEIYARPLERQFTEEFADGEAKVYTHLIKSKKSEDYSRVFEVAKAFAVSDNMPVYILPEINAQEKVFRASLGLSTDNGNTPDIMLAIGRFIDVKSPKVEDKLSRNAGKAARQLGVACITDHNIALTVTRLNEYAKRVFGNNTYSFDEVYFYIKGNLYKRPRNNLGL